MNFRQFPREVLKTEASQVPREVLKTEAGGEY